MTEFEDDIKPIITPLLALLKSRKAITALITALVDLLVLAVPALAANRDTLLTVFTTLGLTLMGLTAAEDNSQRKADALVEAAQHQANAARMNAQAARPPASAVTTPERS